MQVVDKLAEAGLGEVGPGQATQPKPYWPALSFRAIPEIVARCVAVLVALASIAAVALVGVFSFGFYAMATVLEKVRHCAARINLYWAHTTG